ncbi:hypothetical protein [Streptomyces sp. UNOB3_S3]|uniref:hypothetical protein n=1 Tax=Streptomyces sp. UNOB3_S3 TaxID=2871682 RepID=UPI001E2B99A0|nr:hypothetical protein [Streptomyces sp. UNOB3_S3]MCC3775349.1 hypothetical protein [Streptomyces sp. UNOB3_S3]
MADLSLAGNGDDLLLTLLSLASDYRREVEAAWDRERRESEAIERQAAVEQASDFVALHFPHTLAKALPAGAWQGYPSGGESRQPMATAYLGAEAFLIHGTEYDGDRPDGLRGFLLLLHPCPCGDYVETWIDSEYDLAFVLDDLRRADTCEELCRPPYSFGGE